MASVSITATFDGKTYSSSTAVTEAVRKGLQRDLDRGMKEVAVELKAALDKLYADLAARHGTAWPGGTTATTLSVRSGRGIQSIKRTIKVTSEPGEVSGVIATGDMTVHETGAYITPKRAQYLTVPLTPALNGRGMPLRSSAREWDNTFIATSKRGNLIIFQKQTGGKIVPLYLLRKSVSIPPRLGLGKMFEDMVPHFQRKAIDIIERSLHGQ